MLKSQIQITGIFVENTHYTEPHLKIIALFLDSQSVVWHLHLEDKQLYIKYRLTSL